MSFLAFLGPAHSCPRGHQAKELLVSSSQLGQGWEVQSRAELAWGGESTKILCPSYGAAPLLQGRGFGCPWRIKQHACASHLLKVKLRRTLAGAERVGLSSQSRAVRVGHGLDLQQGAGITGWGTIPLHVSNRVVTIS